MRSFTLGLASLLALVLGLGVPAWADEKIQLKQSGGTYTLLGGVADAAKVTIVSSVGTSTSGCTATAAAPTYVEASDNAVSCDLSGNTRVTLGTLLSGEDQTNDLIRVSGGAVRITTFSSVTTATSSAVTTVPVGSKTFMAQLGSVASGHSETKAATLIIYGNWTSSTSGGIALCTITLPSTVTVTHLEDACPVVTANFAFYYYTASVYTSTNSDPLTVYAMY